MRKKHNLTGQIKAFYIGMAVLLFAFLLGPYQYKIESVLGVVYFFFSYLCFYFGLKSKHIRIIKRRKSKIGPYTNKEEIIILVFEIIASICFIVWVIDLVRNFNTNLLFRSDLRNEFSDQRSSLSRIAEFGMSFGVSAFILANTRPVEKRTFIVKLSYVTLWYMGICYLAVGTRWRLFLAIALFLIIKKPKFNIKKHLFLSLIVLVSAVVILNIVYDLFQNRGLMRADQLYLFSVGDMIVKPTWQAALQKSNYSLQGLFRIFSYFGQPIPVFSYIFVHYMPKKIYFGAYMLRFLGLVFNALHIPFPVTSAIANQTFTGMYSGTVYEYIIDWSVYLTPLFLYFTGVIFCNIYKKKSENKICSCLYPITVVMCLFAPFYYIWLVGSVDYVIVCCFVFFVVSKFRIYKKHS